MNEYTDPTSETYTAAEIEDELLDAALGDLAAERMANAKAAGERPISWDEIKKGYEQDD